VDGRPGPSATNPDGTRSFSAIPSVAAADGVAFADGLKEAGVIPVLKHFPGLGGSSGNTDVAPASTLPFSELKTTGLIPFEAAIAANLPVVMVSNATVPGLTSKPASLSSVAINYLRSSLGFKGLVITDSLSAGAIQQIGLTVPEATVRAIEAGADMIMYNTLNPITTFKASVVALDQAVSTGSLSRTRLMSSVEKILKTRKIDLCAN
jgi:beta-N-acetylhexosaminidase